MLSIILVSILIPVLIFFSIILIIRAIRKKVKGERITNFPILIALPFIVVFLGVYDGFLILSSLNDNKYKILDAGQSAISNTIEYGTTAVFEGIGQSFDHFEEKWEDDYIRRLRKVEVEIKNASTTFVDDTHEIVTVDVIFNNHNNEADYLSIHSLGTQNYLLLGDENEVYYPVNILNKENYNYLPSGKTMLQITGQLPKGAKLSLLRLLNEKHKVSLAE